MLTKTKRAYYAGIVDGEGSIYVSHRTGGTEVRVLISNTFRPLIEKAKEDFGVGRISMDKITNPKWKPCYKWLATSRDADKVLRQILPYLTIKRPQAELALAVQSTMGKRTGKRGRGTWRLSMTDKEFREWAVSEVRRMNKRGAVL